jgi:hypothetical protein
MQIYAHVDGSDLGAHHLLPLLIGSFSFLWVYVIVFWAKTRDSIKLAAAWFRKLFRSRR